MQYAKIMGPTLLQSYGLCCDWGAGFKLRNITLTPIPDSAILNNGTDYRTDLTAMDSAGEFVRRALNPAFQIRFNNYAFPSRRCHCEVNQQRSNIVHDCGRRSLNACFWSRCFAKHLCLADNPACNHSADALPICKITVRELPYVCEHCWQQRKQRPSDEPAQIERPLILFMLFQLRQQTFPRESNQGFRTSLR